MNQFLSSLLIALMPSFPALCQQQPKFQVSATNGLVTDPVDIQVNGLKRGQTFRLEAITLDQRSRPWIAHATYEATQNGNMKIADLAPVAGTYSGKDGQGLFWSALYRGIPLDSATRRGTFSRRATGRHSTTIRLQIDQMVVDSMVVERKFMAEGVKYDSVRTNGLQGILFQPGNRTKTGVVIVVAGSDGGIQSASWRAALLASNGIPALALAYFDFDNLPEDLIELPIEYVGKAVTYLKGNMNYQRVGMLGFSKGSELSLTYCSKIPDNGIEAIAVISPGTYMWQGINRNIDVKSSWTIAGQPAAFIPWQYNEEVINMLRARGPKRFRSMYEYSLTSPKNDEKVSAAELNLDHAKAPLLMVAGTEDGSWPADQMVARLDTQLSNNGYPYAHQKVIVDGAGHLIYFDLLPVTDSQRQSGQVFGGTIEANISARKLAWQRVNQFFKTHLLND